MKKSQIEIKVLAVNTLHKYLLEFYAHEKSFYSQFVGQDIFKADGSVKKKFEHERLSFSGFMEDGTHYDAHYWLSLAHGYFDINVKICVNGGSYDVKPVTAFCQYENQSITLFKVIDGKLTVSENETDLSGFLITYKAEDLEKLALSIKEAARVYELESNKMPYIFKQVLGIERLSR